VSYIRVLIFIVLLKPIVMKFTIRFVVAVLLLLGVQRGFSQKTYDNGLGFRLGGVNGLSFKHFVTNANSIELYAVKRYSGLVGVTGLYQWNFYLGNTNGLTWHLGPGLHAAMGKNKVNETDFYLGADLNVGIEYKFDGIPFTVGLDFDLGMNATGDRPLFGDGYALGIRYVW
jgi:hypothetical protein